MKYLNFLVLAISTLFGLLACNEDASGTIVEYKIAPSVIEFPREGGTQYLNVQTTADVEAVCADQWCKVTEEISQSKRMVKFALTAQANPDLTERTAVINLTIGKDIKETVMVTQNTCDLIVDTTPVSLPHESSDFSVKVQTAGEYEITFGDATWISLKEKTESSALFHAKENTGLYVKEAVITFRSADAEYEVPVVQAGNSDSQIAPDKTGMESDAMTLMKKMTLGINLGNTLEAIGGETAWGAPKTTEEIIKYFKHLGFNAIRVPCSWDQNLEEGDGFVVKSSWMDRVKEVVDYIVDNDMYAILNIHWDGGWLENDIPNGYDKEVDAQQHAIWTQIAAAFRNYDEHLVFAGTNEPNVENAAQMETLLKYEQTFIDAVRATGGRNAYRVLVFQGPSTDINKSVELMKKLPTDTVEGRLAAEVHFYDPVQFCLLGEDASWGKMMYFWGDDQGHYATGAYQGKWLSNFNEAHIAKQMAKMKKKFWDNGIPVIIGEFGASTWKTFNLGTDEENRKAEEGFRKSHAAYTGCVVKEAKANGCVPFYWHCEGDIIDRSEKSVLLQETYDAMIEAGKTQYPQN